MSHVFFNNSGTVNVLSGTVESVLGGSTDTSTGTFNLAAPGTLNLISGIHLFNAGTRIIGDGTLNISGGELTLNTDITAANVTLSGGTLNGLRTPTIPGRFDWTGGTLAGTGTTLVDTTGTLAISGPSNKIIDARTLTNRGSGTLSGTANVFTQTGPTFNNAGTFSIQSDADFQFNGGAGLTLNNTGTFVQTAVGRLETELGGEPATGLFGVLTSTGAATLAGSLAIRVSDEFGPRAGGNLVVANFPSHTGDLAQIERPNAGRAANFTAIENPANVTITSIQDATDLDVEAITFATTVDLGPVVPITYTVRNRTAAPSSIARWTDSVFLSLSGQLDANALLFGRIEHVGIVPALRTYTETLRVPLPPVLPGTYPIFVVADSRGFVPDPDRANNTGEAGSQITVEIPTLILGATTNGTIASGRDRYFQINLPSGPAVRISTTFAAAPGGEIFGRYQDVPTRDTFELSAADATRTTQQLSLPGTQAGAYFLLVHGREGSANGRPFSVLVEQLPLQVLEVTPNRGSNAGIATATIRGSQLTPSTTVSLIPTVGAPRAATQVQFGD